MCKNPHKKESRKVTHANFENILGNCCGKGLQGICDGFNHLYGVNDSTLFPKHSRKSLFADGIKQDITNKLRHRKCVRLEMSITRYLESQSKETKQKGNLINILWT